MKRLPRMAGGTREKKAFEQTVQDIFYLSGYTMVETDDHYGEGLCHTRINFSKSTPEGFVYSLLRDTNSVCLITASASVGSILRMFDTDYLGKEGNKITVQNWTKDEIEKAEYELSDRYNNFPELSVRNPNCSIQEDGTVTHQESWAAQHIKFLQHQWGDLKERNKQSALDIFDSAISFVRSVKEDINKPRYLVAVTNSSNEAYVLRDIIVQILEKYKPSERIVSWRISESKELETSHKLEEKEAEFVRMLLDSDEAPILIITAARQSLAVGANLQIKLSKRQIEQAKQCNIAWAKISSYMGKDNQVFRHYPGSDNCQIDMSDMMVAATTSYLIDGDKHKYRQLISLAVSGQVDLDLLSRGAGIEHMRMYNALESTDVIPIEQLEFLNQFIGRSSRTANPPKQTLWLPKKITERVSRLNIAELHENARPVSRQFADFLSWIEKGGNNQAPYAISENDITSQMSGLAQLLFGDDTPIRRKARKIWAYLKIITPYFQILENELLSTDVYIASTGADSIAQQKVIEASLKARGNKKKSHLDTIIMNADKEIKELNEIAGLSFNLPISLRDFYMSLPVKNFRPPYWSSLPSRAPKLSIVLKDSLKVINELSPCFAAEKASKSIEWAKLASSVLIKDGKIYINNDQVSLNALVVDDELYANSQEWKTHHPATLRSLKEKNNEKQKYWVLRPQVKRFMATPFMDEWITREQISMIGMEGVSEEGQLFETADHFIKRWGVFIDNKSSVLWSLESDEAKKDINDKIREARSKLSQSNNYDTFVYVLRHSYSHKKMPPVTGYRRDTFEEDFERADCDVYFVQLSHDAGSTHSNDPRRELNDGLHRVLRVIQSRKMNSENERREDPQ